MRYFTWKLELVSNILRAIVEGYVFFSVWITRYLLAMYIFRTLAKKFRLGENAGHMLALIGKNPEWRSSHWRCSMKMFFKNFAKFTEKYPCQSLFFNKVAGVRFQLYLLFSAWYPPKGHTYLNKPPKLFFCKFCEEFLRMCLYRVHSGDYFWMCLLFFDFRFVLLLYSFVKLSVRVMFGCRVLENC